MDFDFCLNNENNQNQYKKKRKFEGDQHNSTSKLMKSDASEQENLKHAELNRFTEETESFNAHLNKSCEALFHTCCNFDR
jgi:uncharacterized membrane protein YcjF (UPF0283 family)